MKKIRNNWFGWFACLTLVLAGACSDDETESGSETVVPPTLSTAEMPEDGYHFLYSATTPKTFTLTTNAPWEITKDAGWFVVTPKSGDAGENIEITVTGQYNEADARTGSFVIRANSGNKLHPCYTEQTVALKQDAYLAAGIIITGAEADHVVFTANETTARTIQVEASYDWTLTADNESWYAISPKQGKGGEVTTLTITPRANTQAKTNKAELTIRAVDAEFPENTAEQKLTLKQFMPTDTHAAGYSFFTDDFNWIPTNWVAPYCKYGWPSVDIDGENGNQIPLIKDGTPSAIGAVAKEKGYEYSDVDYACYEGHLKLGVTATMGYITLPALAIDADKGATLLLQFDAAQYSSAGGTVDKGDDKMYVTVDGDATVGDQVKTTTGVQLNNVWFWKRYSVLLYNVTATTRIQIGASNAAKCRLYLDNVEVTRAADKGATAPAPKDVVTPLDKSVTLNQADAVYPTAMADVFNKDGQVVQEGATLVYTVRVNRAWTAECDAEWLSIAGVRCGATGTGTNNGAKITNGTAEVTATSLPYNNTQIAVSKNTDPETRTGHVVIKSDGATIETITVTQESGSAVRLTIQGLTENKAEVNYDSASASVVKFSITGTHDWSIASSETWISATPTSGKAGVKTDVTLKASENNKGIRRFGTLTITTVKPETGDPASEQIIVSQQTAAVGSVKWNMQEPIQWKFSVADTLKYSPDFASWHTPQRNAMPSITTDAPGYLSYTHTAPQDPNGKCVRIIGGTGEPYITGGWPGDSWQFTVPVANMPANTKVHFTGIAKTSGTGHKYWTLEYKDGGTWKPASTVLTTTVNGSEITYTHEHKNTAALPIDVTLPFTNAIADGTIEIRYRCMANWQASGKGALAAPNGGTCRWTSADGITGPKIEIAE